jgi:hypothetical protein
MRFSSIPPRENEQGKISKIAWFNAIFYNVSVSAAAVAFFGKREEN